MDAMLTRLNACLLESFPVAAAPAQGASMAYALALFEAPQLKPARGGDVAAQELWQTLQLIIYEVGPSGRLEIHTIKEQHCLIAILPDGAPEARFACFIQGWAAALAVLFARPGAQLHECLPDELTAPKVSLLLKPQTSADFEAAFLTKGRLGRWLAPA